MHSLLARGAITALIIAPAFAAPLHAEEVRIFEHAPSASEVLEMLGATVPPPAPAPRYRSIEITGGALKSMQNNASGPAIQASLETRESHQVMTHEGHKAVPAQVIAPAPSDEAAAAPSAHVATAQEQPREEHDHATADRTTFGFVINFSFDSAVIPSDAYAHLDAVGGALNTNENVSILVEGHTDAAGSDAYNMKLSERRAEAVQTYLVEKHRVTVSRIQAIGLGEEEPLSANPLDRINRRVQFARVD